MEGKPSRYIRKKRPFLLNGYSQTAKGNKKRATTALLPFDNHLETAHNDHFVP
jgi:hypothetical protein